MEDDLSLRELERFCGTMQYHGVMGLKVTDGVAYIMQNGYSWLVTDAIALIRMHEDFKNQPFICIKLKRLIDGGCKVIYTDGNDNLLYDTNMTFTTAQRDLTLFCIDGILLLSGEY